MKRTLKITAYWLALIIFCSAFVSEKDALHKKIYIVQITEYRDGKPKPKTIEDEIEFKDGKVFSTFAFDKMQFSWMKYKIKIDSTYLDEEIEKKYYEIDVMNTNKEDETLTMNIKIDEYEIEGTMKLTKGDKPKKQFEFSGKEKVKKK